MINVIYFIIPLVMSALLVPLAKKIGIWCRIYAMENERTVHHGLITRCGGLAIYVAFVVCISLFMNADRQLNALLIGATIVFFSGLVDDMNNLSPKVKFLFQAIAALILIFYGKVQLNVFRLPFGIVIRSEIIISIISFFWVTGITNSINLIDGLDGLASGVCVIALITIASLAYIDKHYDVMMISLILAGATSGFLLFNFHPASIFMGDSGALFLGFVISGISLLGFKSSTFLTLGVPILVLGVPIMDTLSSIVRRTVHRKKFSEADRSHLHHVLMYKLEFGHRNSVLIIYFFTLLLSINAYVYIWNKVIGLAMLVALGIGVELFLELTGMISNRYRPLISAIVWMGSRWKKTNVTANNKEPIKTSKSEKPKKTSKTTKQSNKQKGK